MRLIYTAGVWDILHRGHINFLRESAKLGDVLIVGVVTDCGTEAYKHILPTQDQWTRLKQVRQLPWVTFATLQDGTDPSNNLRRFLPDIFTHGDDWHRLKQGHDTLEELGIEYVTVPYTPNVSSTQLREALNG